MKKISLILATALVAFACQKENMSVEGNQELTAPKGYKALVISADAGKCAIADDGTSTWEAGDSIAVYDGTEICKFTLVSVAGTSSGEFHGYVNEAATDLTAVYPFDAALLEEGSFSATVPAVQTIGTRSFGVISATTNISTCSLSFEAASAVVRFSVPSGVDKVIFHGEKDSNLALDSDQVEVILPNTDGGVYEASVNDGTYVTFNAFVHKGGKFYAKEGNSMLGLTAGEIKPLGTIDSTEEAVLIYTKSDLDAFAATPSTSAYLCADIDFNGGAFTPIAEFAKTFNGQNYNLYKFNVNFTSDATGVLNEGLFTKLNGATVKNLSVGEFTDTIGYSDASGVSVNKHDNADKINCAVVAGEIDGATIKNVKSYAWIQIGGDCSKLFNVGGIAGLASGTPSTIEGCCQDIEVRCNGTYSTASPYPLAGGILGYDCAGCTIKGCTNYADIISNCIQVRYFGGIVGRYETGISTPETIINCENYGNISNNKDILYSSKSMVGGICGFQGSAESVINGCKNYGSLAIGYKYTKNTNENNVAFNVGGIVGTSYGSIISCENEATLTYTPTQNAGRPRFGGIAGSEKAPIAITSCKNTGDIVLTNCEKNSFLGGIIGYLADATTSISSCSSNCTIYTTRAIATLKVGGIVGYLDNGTSISTPNFVGCTVEGTYGTKEANGTAVGMIIGDISNAENVIVVGTGDTPVTVKGKWGLNKIDVTSDALHCVGTGYAGTGLELHAVLGE